MNIAQRLNWIKALWRAIIAGLNFKKEKFPSTGKGDIMSTIPIGTLDAIANAFKTAVHGKAQDDIISLAEIANSIPIPQAGLISTGLKILAQYEPIIEALIKQGKIKGHNTGEGGVGADPAGNGGFGV